MEMEVILYKNIPIQTVKLNGKDVFVTTYQKKKVKGLMREKIG